MENNNNNNNSNGNNADKELDRFKQILNNKINEKNNQIFQSHSYAYNNNVQDEMHCLRCVLRLTNYQRQMQMSQVEGLVRKKLMNLREKWLTQ